nr:MAG TPA: hypothetical protein [Crassvirales sp.]
MWKREESSVSTSSIRFSIDTKRERTDSII